MPLTVICLFFGEFRQTRSSGKGITVLSLSFFGFDDCFLAIFDGVGDPESLLSGDNLDLSAPFVRLKSKEYSSIYTVKWVSIIL